MQEAVEHFKLWLRRSTGCLFAARLVRNGRVAYEPHEEVPNVDDLDAGLDVHGEQARSAIILLPPRARPPSSTYSSRSRTDRRAGASGTVVARRVGA